jgi:hypothetical protein
MAEYRDGYKVDPSTGLTKPEERAGLTRSEAEATAKEPDDICGAPAVTACSENAVIFKKSQADDFERVRLAVEHYIIAKHSGGAPIAAAPDIPEQIKKLGELREQGLLTDEQFEAKRDELLSRM